MSSLKDATVLVTGANGGLGTAYVDVALERGARRVYAAARNPRKWADERVEPPGAGCGRSGLRRGGPRSGR
ncbi:KR domain-containing protein [Streptomyces sp. NPDC001953]